MHALDKGINNKPNSMYLYTFWFIFYQKIYYIFQVFKKAINITSEPTFQHTVLKTL